MEKFLTVLFLVLTGIGAQADEALGLEKVLDAITLDLNGDAEFDRAVLVEGEAGSADLYIYLSQREGDNTSLKLAVQKKSVVSNGPLWGQQASLSLNYIGSLVVKSQNLAVGRTKWQQELKIIYRNQKFLVAGVTHKYQDLREETCDLNFLTARGTHKGKVIVIEGGVPSIDAWSDDQVYKICQLD